MNERSDSISSSFYIKQVGLDSLVGGDGKAGDFLLPGREGLDRALPARLRMSVFKETIRGEIVNRDRNDEPPHVRRTCAPSQAHRSRLLTLQDVVCQERFLRHIRLR